MAQPIKRALVSVSDKTGLVDFVRQLVDHGVEILSTGGTARKLSEAGIPVTGVSDYTGFPEMMDGRVKTLHPKIHGALLGLRDNDEHVAAMNEHGIIPIDMVVVNLYPFEQTVAKEDVDLAEAIENIDIGGPSMVRSAAKNYRFVAIVSDPSYYDEVLENMKANDGAVDDSLRQRLALAAFRHTAHYDRAISNYLDGVVNRRKFPGIYAPEYELVGTLRYGENPAQDAAFYKMPGAAEPSVTTGRQLHGKELSYNNIYDINAAYEIVKEFDVPAVSVIKHTNPCGAAVAGTLEEATRKAVAGDPLSAFGGIVAFNRPVSMSAAEALADKDHFVECIKAMEVDKYTLEMLLDNPGLFLEAIIAPGFDDGVVAFMAKNIKGGKNLRVIETPPLDGTVDAGFDVKRVTGGMLVQDRDTLTWKNDQLKVVTKRQPSEQEMKDLLFAWVIAKHTRSNAITLAKDEMVVGNGAGQMSRVDAAMLADHKAHGRTEGAVMSSDAFFPFPDGVEWAGQKGVTAVIQPGGSRNDDEVIKVADKYDLAMVFTGLRHFYH